MPITAAKPPRPKSSRITEKLAGVLVLALVASLIPVAAPAPPAHANVTWPSGFSVRVGSGVLHWRGLSTSARLQHLVVADTDTPAVHRSDSFGTNWSDVTPDLVAGEIPYATAQSWDGNIIHVATSAGVWRSTSAANTWTFTPVASDANEAWTSIASSDDGQTVVISTRGETLPAISTDGGATFAPVTFAERDQNSRFGTVSVDGMGRRIVMTVQGTANGVWISETAGASFTRVSTADDYSHAALSNAGNTILAARTGGNVRVEIFDYDPDNTVWDAVIPTLGGATPSRDVVGLALSADGTRMIASVVPQVGDDNGFTYRSPDRGATWEQVQWPQGTVTNALTDGVGLSRDGYAVAYMAGRQTMVVTSSLRVADGIASPTLDHGGGIPHAGSQSAAVEGPLTLQFMNQTLDTNVGTIRLLDVDTLTDAAVFDVTDPTQVTVTGSTVTLHTTQPLAYETTYALLIDPGTFRHSGADYGGINNLVELRFTTAAEPPPPPPPPPPVVAEPDVTPPEDDSDEPSDAPATTDDTAPSGEENPSTPQGEQSLPLPAPRPSRPLLPPAVDVETDNDTQDDSEPDGTLDSSESDTDTDVQDTSANVLAERADETTNPATTYQVTLLEILNGERLRLPRGTQTVAFDAAVLAALVATLNGGVQPPSDGILTVFGAHATVDVDAQNPSAVAIARNEIGRQLTFMLHIAGVTVGERQLVVTDARLLWPTATLLLLLAGAGVGLIAVSARRRKPAGTQNKTSVV